MASDKHIDHNSFSSKDRYSRLTALEKMGVVKDYSLIRQKTVILIGVGGIGSSTSEMLVRCGIGKLIIFDYDTVEMANMNRMFYTPKHLGIAKVWACMEALKEINPDVLIEVHDCDVSQSYDLLLEQIKFGSIDRSKVDLLLCCVDNYAARVTISQACNETNQCWMNSGVSENATTGQIQTCIPGYSACFQCAPPLIVSTGDDEKSLKRDLVCTASLPTTMGIIAGLLTQNVLKFLLKFGRISWFLGYDSISNFFPSYYIAPNPECNDPWCILQQKNYDPKNVFQSQVADSPPDEDENFPLSIHNEYGIEIIDDKHSEEFVQTNFTPSNEKHDTSKTLEEISNDFRNLMS